LEPHFERPSLQARGYGLSEERKEIKYCEFVQETVDPSSVKGLGNM